MPDAVLYEKRGNIAYITLNRPEKLNTVNTAMADGILASWQEFVRDDDAWVAVLTGAGDRAFCAGVDITDPGQGQPGVPNVGIEIFKPIIVAVRGYCLGSGIVMAMQSDIRIAASDAQFGYPEAKVGVTGGIGASLIKYLPKAIAMEMLFTARPISAQRAYEVGFVNKVVEPEYLMAEASEMAETIAQNAPLVNYALKELAFRDSHLTLREAHGMAERILAPVRDSQDSKEGPRAFMEKRPPNFKGK